MDIHEAIEILIDYVSGYFVDDPTDFGIGHMREHYLPNKSHPRWGLVKSAFETVLAQYSGTELNEFVEYKFNREVSLLPEGARGFLTHIYKSVFEAE